MAASNSDSNKFSIEFISINITDDGDDFSEGEIFYNFRVDNETIIANSPERSFGIDSGNSIELTTGYGVGQHASTTVIKNHDESFTVYGIVGDVDDLATGENDIAGTFEHKYSGNDGWWESATIGTTKIVKQRLNQDGMDVTVNYKITYVSGDPIIDLGPYTPPLPPPINIADGGVILYQGENYNSRFTGIDRLRLTSPSQHFGVGDFNLPVDITHSQTSPFGGPSRLFRMPGLPPNTTSSIRVGTQIQVTLYDKMINERHLGTSTVLFEDVAFLNRLEYNGIGDSGENGWNNKVMSIKVEHYEFHVS